MKRELDAACTLAGFKRGRWENKGLHAVMDEVRVKLRCGIAHPPETQGRVWRYAGKPAWCPCCGQCTPSVQYQPTRGRGGRHCMACCADRL